MARGINRLRKSPTIQIIQAVEWDVLPDNFTLSVEEPMIKQDNRQIRKLYGKKNREFTKKPLTTRDIARFRALLLEYREEVLEDLKSERETLRSSRAVDQSLGPWDPDFTGDSVETESSEYAVIQIRRLTATLEQITAALTRLEQGSYGNCTRCGLVIEKERLEAIPYTRRCMSCKTAVEAA